MLSRVVNWTGFYCGWFACVGGAASGRPWLGPITVAGLLAVHLWMARRAGREIALLAVAGAIGFAVDTLQASFGLYTFRHGGVASWLSPPWMVALWILFASTLNASLAWLAGRYGLAAVLGVLFGPMSYVAGARLGAIELSADTRFSVVGIGAAWALALPTLLAVREKLCGRGV